MPADPQIICARYLSLKNRRALYDGHCEDVARHVMPNHQGFSARLSPGGKRMQSIVDGIGIHSNELLAAGLHGLMTNPASKWFGLRMVGVEFEEDDQVRDWLADVSDMMRAYMYAPGSNITTALHEAYLDLGAFGTSVLFIGERDAGGLLFQTRPLNECYIAENHEGVVDTVYRNTIMTARQVMQQWPDTASEYVRACVTRTDKLDEPVEIIHAVQPRRERDGGKLNQENMPWESIYIEMKTRSLLEESGFPEFPYAVPRWSKFAGEEYGRSPAMTALPDIKMLQEMERTMAMASELAALPPINVPDDGSSKPINYVPGGFVFYRGDRGPEPWRTNTALPVTEQMQEARRDRVRAIFFADLMNFPTDVRMTATEFTQRMAERMRLLGPMMGRLEGEMLGRIIERSFGILNRMGAIPPPPPQIQGREFSIEFVSPVALAQKQGEANAITQTLNVLLPFIQATQSAEVLKPFKLDRLAPKLFDVFGGDPDLIYTADEMAEMAEQEAQAQQAAQMAQMAQPMADAAQKGAGALDKMASAQQKGADLSQLLAGSDA